MAYVYVNINPSGKIVDDCVIRAVGIALNMTWDEAFSELSDMAFHMKNLPNANVVWGALLKSMGFTKCNIPNTCPDCYTVRDFTIDHPRGVFVLCTGTHAVTVIDGDYMDVFDSGDLPVSFFWVDDSYLHTKL